MWPFNDVYGVVAPFRSTFGLVATSLSYCSNFLAGIPIAAFFAIITPHAGMRIYSVFGRRVQLGAVDIIPIGMAIGTNILHAMLFARLQQVLFTC